MHVGDDVRCIKEHRFGQSRKCAAPVISCNYGFAECRLMQPLLDRAKP
jgi:hypothetical protein